MLIIKKLAHSYLLDLPTATVRKATNSLLVMQTSLSLLRCSIQSAVVSRGKQLEEETLGQGREFAGHGLPGRGVRHFIVCYLKVCC